jgi:NAD-dependent dihydropyrimidine dehydrogenase PreA subunit
MNTILYIVGAILVLWFIGGFYRHLQGKNRTIHVIESNCTGCKRCITNMRKCKHNVLDLVNDENGKHIVVKYADHCTACGDCVSVCKFNALELVRRKNI